MKISLRGGLPFVSVTLEHNNQFLVLENVLLDTGSAGTIFSIDEVLAIGLQYEDNDTVRRIRGVGGAEFVFSKRINSLSLEDIKTVDFDIEIGAMDYGFKIDGIIGMDLLTRIGAVIDLSRLEIKSSTPNA